VDERKEREDRGISVGDRMRGGGMKKGEGKGLKWREGKRKGGGMGKEGRDEEEEHERRLGEGGIEHEGGRVGTVKEAQAPKMKMSSAAYGWM